MRTLIGSGSFQVDKPAGLHILKVFGWTIVSAAVALLLNLLGVVKFPPEYAFIIPIINTILVALQQFIVDKSKE